MRSCRAALQQPDMALRDQQECAQAYLDRTHHVTIGLANCTVVWTARLHWEACSCVS